MLEVLSLSSESPAYARVDPILTQTKPLAKRLLQISTSAVKTDSCVSAAAAGTRPVASSASASQDTPLITSETLAKVIINKRSIWNFEIY